MVLPALPAQWSKYMKSGQASDWADRGIAFSALVIEHVITSREFKDEDRNLHYVLQLLLAGNIKSAETANEIFS